MTPVILSNEIASALESHLMLCFTGSSRFASNVAQEKVKSFAEKADALHQMRDMVDVGCDYLNQGRLPEFARLLDESWRLKRSLSSFVTNREIDDIYDVAKKNGAMGGKLLGAGGGGFFMFIVPPERQEQLKSVLSGKVFVHPKIDWVGSQVAFYQPEGI